MRSLLWWVVAGIVVVVDQRPEVLGLLFAEMLWGVLGDGSGIGWARCNGRCNWSLVAWGCKSGSDELMVKSIGSWEGEKEPIYSSE